MVNDAIPIFSKARSSSLRRSECSRDLLFALYILTAKLTGYKFASAGFNLDARIDSMLSSGLLQEDIFGDSPTLDQFRKACLLAFYEFHQFPGQQAWMRMGKLTRMAYWIGLDRLENARSTILNWNSMSQHELEDWRAIWWCIYRFDSYVNLSAGTPFLVDDGLVNTALMGSRLGTGNEQDSLRQKLYLPSQPDRLWELIPDVTSDPERNSLFNIHIITATVMRQVGRSLRQHMLRPCAESIEHLGDLERRISALRLALPTNYLNPMRNAFSNESKVDHHERLVTLFQLLMARLLMSIARCSYKGEGEEWVLSWQQVLEVCQDIASVSEQWNSTFTLSVDPALSFIIFTSLIFLDLHKKSAAASSLASDIKHCETVLSLQLEQFANIWTLPRLLLRKYIMRSRPIQHNPRLTLLPIQVSYRSFKELLIGPLSRRHIKLVLTRFEAPLHPRWLRFLSSAQADLESCM